MLPDDLRDYRARNENALAILEAGIGVAIGTLAVYLTMLLVLSLN